MERDELTEIKHLFKTQNDINILMKELLSIAKKGTKSDAGTVYLMDEKDMSLQFIAVQNDTLFLDLSKVEDNIPWPNLQIYDENQKLNDINASVVCAVEDKLFNVPDVRKYEKFDFEGPKAFDKYTGYDTVSMLIAPVKDQKGKVIGVLQLINKKDEDEEIVSFGQSDEEFISNLLKACSL